MNKIYRTIIQITFFLIILIGILFPGINILLDRMYDGDVKPIPILSWLALGLMIFISFRFSRWIKNYLVKKFLPKLEE
jgi:hypothetical protein